MAEQQTQATEEIPNWSQLTGSEAYKNANPIDRNDMLQEWQGKVIRQAHATGTATRDDYQAIVGRVSENLSGFSDSTENRSFRQSTRGQQVHQLGRWKDQAVNQAKLHPQYSPQVEADINERVQGRIEKYQGRGNALDSTINNIQSNWAVGMEAIRDFPAKVEKGYESWRASGNEASADKIQEATASSQALRNAIDGNRGVNPEDYADSGLTETQIANQVKTLNNGLAGVKARQQWLEHLESQIDPEQEAEYRRLQAEREGNVAALDEKIMDPESQGLATLMQDSPQLQLTDIMTSAAPEMLGAVGLTVTAGPQVSAPLTLAYYAGKNASDIDASLKRDKPEMRAEDRFWQSILFGTGSATAETLPFGRFANPVRWGMMDDVLKSLKKTDPALYKVVAQQAKGGSSRAGSAIGEGVGETVGQVITDVASKLDNNELAFDTALKVVHDGLKDDSLATSAFVGMVYGYGMQTTTESAKKFFDKIDLESKRMEKMKESEDLLSAMQDYDFTLRDNADIKRARQRLGGYADQLKDQSNMEIELDAKSDGTETTDAQQKVDEGSKNMEEEFQRVETFFRDVREDVEDAPSAADQTPVEKNYFSARDAFIEHKDSFDEEDRTEEGYKKFTAKQAELFDDYQKAARAYRGTELTTKEDSEKEIDTLQNEYVKIRQEIRAAQSAIELSVVPENETPYFRKQREADLAKAKEVIGERDPERLLEGLKRVKGVFEGGIRDAEKGLRKITKKKVEQTPFFDTDLPVTEQAVEPEPEPEQEVEVEETVEETTDFTGVENPPITGRELKRIESLAKSKIEALTVAYNEAQAANDTTKANKAAFEVSTMDNLQSKVKAVRDSFSSKNQESLEAAYKNLEEALDNAGSEYGFHIKRDAKGDDPTSVEVEASPLTDVKPAEREKVQVTWTDPETGESITRARVFKDGKVRMEGKNFTVLKNEDGDWIAQVQDAKDNPLSNPIDRVKSVIDSADSVTIDGVAAETGFSPTKTRRIINKMIKDGDIVRVFNGGSKKRAYAKVGSEEAKRWKVKSSEELMAEDEIRSAEAREKALAKKKAKLELELVGLETEANDLRSEKTKLEAEMGRATEGGMLHNMAKSELRAVKTNLAKVDKRIKTVEGQIEKIPKAEEQVPIDTTTDSFDNWFGDSKVVDSNGNPLVVYHGTAYGRFEDQDAQIESYTEETKALKSQQEDVLKSLGENRYKSLKRQKELLGYLEERVRGAKRKPKDLRDRAKEYEAKGVTRIAESALAEIPEAESDYLAIQKEYDADVEMVRKLKEVEDLQNKIDKRQFYSSDPDRAGKAIFDTRSNGDTDTGYLASGSYFTADKSVADDYAKSTGTYKDAIKRDAYTYDVYLSLQNPYNVDTTSDEMKAKVANTQARIYKQKTQYERDLDALGLAQSEASREAMIEHGFDGQIGDYGQGIEYVAFYSNQIKSATKNSGQYDPKSSDIYESRLESTSQRSIAPDEAIPNEENPVKSFDSGEVKRSDLKDFYDQEDFLPIDESAMVEMATQLTGNPVLVNKILNKNPMVMGTYQRARDGKDPTISLQAGLAAGPIVATVEGKQARMGDDKIIDYALKNPEILEKNPGLNEDNIIVRRPSDTMATVHMRDHEHANRTLTHETGHAINDMDYTINPETGEVEGQFKDGESLLGKFFGLNEMGKETYLGKNGVLFNEKALIKELSELTKWWSGPYNQDAKAYRTSPDELFAEAMSVLFSAPKQLQKRAPMFYKSLQEQLARKPHFKKAYDKFMKERRDGLDTEAMYQRSLKRNQTLYERDKNGVEQNAKFLSRMMDVGAALGDAVFSRRSSMALYDKRQRARLKQAMRALDKKGMSREEYAEKKQMYKNMLKQRSFNYKNSAAVQQDTLYASVIARNYTALNHQLSRQLKAAGVSIPEFNTYWEALRTGTEGDRADFFNPNFRGKEADKVVAHMNKLLGSQKTADLLSIREDMLDAREQLFTVWVNSGIFTPAQMNAILNNKHYGRIDVLGDMARQKAFSETEGNLINHQIGTLKQLEKQIWQETILRDTYITNLAYKNQGKKDLLVFLDSSDVSVAEKKDGQFLLPPDSADQVLMKVMKEGEVFGYYVPSWTEGLYSSAQSGVSLAVARAALAPIRQAFIMLNTGFAVANVPRDTVNAWMTSQSWNPLKFAGSYGKAWRETWRATHEGKWSKVIIKGSLEGLTHMDSPTNMLDIENMSDVDYWGQLGNAMKHHKLVNNKFGKAVSKLWDNKVVGSVTNQLSLYKFNQFSETIHKIAAIKRGEGEGNARTPASRRRIIRETGSPAYLDMGKWGPMLNLVSLFTTPALQGHKQQYQAVKENPLTYLSKRLIGATLKLMPAFLGIRGFFGDEIKEWWTAVDQNDVVGYNIIPISPTYSREKGFGFTDPYSYDAEGRAMYSKIAKDYTQLQLESIVLGSMYNNQHIPLGVLADAVPLFSRNSDNPYQRIAKDTADYMKGTVPLDRFGRKAVDPTLTGTARGWEEYMRYQWDTVFGSLLPMNTKEGVESKIPFLSGAINRMVDRSDYGRVQWEKNLSKASIKDSGIFIAEYIDHIPAGLTNPQIRQEAARAYSQYEHPEDVKFTTFAGRFKARYQRRKQR